MLFQFATFAKVVNWSRQWILGCTIEFFSTIGARLKILIIIKLLFKVWTNFINKMPLKWKKFSNNPYSDQNVPKIIPLARQVMDEVIEIKKESH